MKKNKQVEEQILAKKKKNENEICPGTAAKKNTTGCNNCYTKTEKSQNQTTENGEKRDNKKSSWKRDIQKQIKLKDRERQCKCRKNIQKICLSKKDSKSLKNESTPGKRKSENEICTIVKKNKQVEEQILAKKKKSENEICPGTVAKKNTTGCNNCYTKTEKSQNQTTENGEKRDNKKSSLKRDIQKQIKLKDRERQCKRRKNIQKICLSKKDSKSLKNESTPGKRKSENEICTIVKKNKQVEEQILAKKKKSENEICPGTAAKKNTTGCNNCYTKTEKSQNQTTENGEKRDNKKSSWKRDIQKQIKLKDRERQCKHRKNIQKICLSKKDSKSLKNESTPGKRKSENEICTIVKKNKQVEEQILAKKKKSENEICPDTAAKKNTTGCNNCYTKTEKSQNQTTENGEKRDNKKSSWKRDIQKQIKLKDRKRQCKRRKNIQKMCLSKKDSKSLKNESTPGKRKSENEICTIVKKNKQVEEQILAKKKKSENEICPGTVAKKNTTGCNNCYTKTEKSQNQTTENGEKRDNKKSSWKRDIQKQIKLKERERQCKRRKNLQKICLPMKDKKSLRKRNVAKIIKLQERTRQCEKRKNLQKECVFNEGNNNNVKENINFIHNEETHVKSVKNYDKRQVLNIVKEKKRIKEQQRRNCNTLQINTNVKSRNFKKKIHVSTILQKQNLANALKSYAMCNLRTKYKILQRVKIMRQKQISKGIKNN